MEAWLSWTLVLAISGALYYYYSQNDKRGRQRAANTVTPKDTQWRDPGDTSKPSAKTSKLKVPRKPAKKSVQGAGDKAGAYRSTASSNAGEDAHDDPLPAQSPTLGATSPVSAPSGRDVSDMLDPKTARSVLKISASEKPARPPKPQQLRAEPTSETKKQRQNKKRNEDAKAARDAAEEERKKLLEEQRRTAREARGEPSRNGLAGAQPPMSNPWSRAPAPASSSNHSVVAGGQLLDTIDAVSTASSSEAANKGTATTPDSTSYANLPSEEDQMRMAMEDSAWTTVPKGKKQKKNKAGGEALEEESDPVTGALQDSTPAPMKATSIKKQEDVKPPTASHFEALPEPAKSVSHPMDSDWPVV